MEKGFESNDTNMIFLSGNFCQYFRKHENDLRATHDKGPDYDKINLFKSF